MIKKNHLEYEHYCIAEMNKKMKSKKKIPGFSMFPDTADLPTPSTIYSHSPRYIVRALPHGTILTQEEIIWGGEDTQC